ncbi:hypothetical protein [Hyphomicrobium sp. ghe19]|nr:hypothetical protein HYPP_03807 [Hyphomicrobium sp. ghe19]
MATRSKPVWIIVNYSGAASYGAASQRQIIIAEYVNAFDAEL